MSSLFVVPGQIVEVSQENKNTLKEEKQEETHGTDKKSANNDAKAEKRVDTGTKLDGNSNGTKGEDTENGTILDGPANNRSSGEPFFQGLS